MNTVAISSFFTDQALSPARGFSLLDVHRDALEQTRRLVASGQLSEEDFRAITTTTDPHDVARVLTQTGTHERLGQSNLSRARRIMEPLVIRLERFTGAIDMLAQSSPAAFGVNLVGLIWGSLKFVLTASPLASKRSTRLTLHLGISRHSRYIRCGALSTRVPSEQIAPTGNICGTFRVFKAAVASAPHDTALF